MADLYQRYETENRDHGRPAWSVPAIILVAIVGVVGFMAILVQL